MENSLEKFNGKAKELALATAAILALQASPNALLAQSGNKTTPTSPAKNAVPGGDVTVIKAKTHDKRATQVWLVGSNQGNPIFKNDRGEFFSLDPVTGDLIFLNPEEFTSLKLYQKDNPNWGKDNPRRAWKLSGTDIQKITIVGLDGEGHVLQQNSRGEVFYMDPTTGDFIFVKK